MHFKVLGPPKNFRKKIDICTQLTLIYKLYLQREKKSHKTKALTFYFTILPR